ncbi:MAG: hypothetical protein NWF07_08690 [Candidatus Bathyarchaeota archaeon]|nr:hypothetical protein [Candidatus Bathyarchaeota archaeon]
MEQTTLNRIKLEMQSFKGLIITNFIGAAFTIAFTVAFSMPKIIPLLVDGVIDVMMIPYLILTVAGFVVAITWITRSAELMSDHDDIVTELDNISPEDDEAIINVIVQSLAFYRENQPKIVQMGWLGRIVGGFLLLTAVPQIQALVTGDYPLGQWMAIGQVFGLAGTLAVAALGLYAPTIISRFTEKWDARLSITDEAGEKLDRILEG